ncbi:hypothetical protein LMG27177_06329 [Paraburkholderia fynbosensis]|uniref:Transposase IS66 central domain-containing protein n=1 Tax=Paraburkholderia fynbosensis TaxID=1200993 RepID=A0A6J5GX36_9BURK|nr:hypothetical protein LMG27177_06329 [Paraburkholderia fynbosensis]
MYAREGVELDRSLLAKWVGHAATLLQPLVEALRSHVMSATKLHADDTPVPVLAPGNGKTKTGRLWAYVRDDRTSADMTPPAVWFAYTPDRKGIHPQKHLGSFNGTLQADAYGGYRAIYETGHVTEAACWAHARRQFYELHAARPNAFNTEALERIGELYRIEEAIRGKPPDERRVHRHKHARPLLDQFHAWLTTTLETLSRKSDTSRAILYALNCSPEQTPAANVLPQSTVSLAPQNSTASIPRRICASCSHASPTMRLTASTNWRRGSVPISSAPWSETQGPSQYVAGATLTLGRCKRLHMERRCCCAVGSIAGLVSLSAHGHRRACGHWTGKRSGLYVHQPVGCRSSHRRRRWPGHSWAVFVVAEPWLTCISHHLPPCEIAVFGEANEDHNAGRALIRFIEDSLTSESVLHKA